jgi:hypothetical protein
MARAKKSTLGAGQSTPQIMRWLWNGRKYKKAGETPYKEEVDDARKAKPVGYRFTDEGAKKVGVSKYKKPTKAEVEALKKKKTRSGAKVIYRETRQNKTDVSPKSRK